MEDNHVGDRRRRGQADNGDRAGAPVGGWANALSLKDAAKALGISYSTVYQMTVQGDIEWVGIGNRKFISRELLMKFIKAHTHRGYYNAR